MDEYIFGLMLGLCSVCLAWAYITHITYEAYIALLLAFICIAILLLMGINQK